MSSATVAAAAAATDGTSSAVERRTYWCHECDMSVSIISTAIAASSRLCPYCRNDFLEELDHPTNPNPSPNPTDNLIPENHDSREDIHQNNGSNFPFPSAAGIDDNFLLDSPYLHRLIHQLSNTTDAVSAPSATIHRHHNPTSKVAIDSIPTIKITDTFLESDPEILCAVCKDQFAIDDEIKQLPCNHIYHPDCILPWLKTRNSCPVCRFKMPSDEVGFKGRRRRERMSVRLESLMSDEYYTLRHIARRHRLVFPVSRRENGVEMVEGEGESRRENGVEMIEGVGESRRENGVEMIEGVGESTPFLSSAEAEVGVLGRENSVETVSSWPSWPMEGEIGDQEIGASSRRNNVSNMMS